MEKKHGTFLIIIGVVIALLMFWGIFGKSSVSYKTIVLESKSGALTKLDSGEIEIPESLLNEMGAQGWELVDTVTEIETVHPNFGDEQYVTGLQPNVRQRSVTLIFKK